MNVGFPIWIMAAVIILVTLVVALYLRRWTIAGPAIAIFLGLALAYAWIVAHPTWLPTERPAATAAMPWLPDQDSLRSADIYSTIAEADAALARKMAAAIPAMTASRSVVSQVWIQSTPEALAEGFRSHLFPKFPRIATTRPVELAPNDVSIEYRRTTDSGHTVVQATAHGANGAQTFTVPYADKPWVTDLDTYAAQKRDRRLLVGFSTWPCTSADEALQSARGNAVPRIRQLVVVPPHASGVSEPILANAAISAARDLQIDQFVQSFSRPYGTIWRAAVLIDASNDRIAGPQQQLSHLAQAQQFRQRSSIVSIAALLLVVYLVYLLLNTLTKGYYTTRLRVVSVFAIAAGIVVVCLLFIA